LFTSSLAPSPPHTLIAWKGEYLLYLILLSTYNRVEIPHLN
jgi:hypothetical protein